jgi:hypothetical protein
MFRSADNGVHTFTGVVLNTANASSSITATDMVTVTITGSTGISVTSLMFGATATLITGGTRDGFIFVAGGNTKSDGTGTTLSSTWFYNPASSTLSAGPALAFPRAFHTATSIGGGQILVAGGKSGATGFTEFELCSLDGLAPSCATTGGTLATSRCNAAAALVSATQVLVAGGDSCANTTGLTSWDLWDSAAPSTTLPVSNTGTNKLALGRRLFTATVIGTGKVLLAGGAETATADLFILGATSTVVPTTGGMLVTRFGHTATLLSSATATTACPTSTAANSCVLIAGGSSIAGTTWEVYDPSTDTFPTHASAGNDLASPRSMHSAAAFTGGKVLLAGGTDGSIALNTTEVFDPRAVTLSFNFGAGLQLARSRSAAAYAPAQNVLVLVGGNAVGPSTEQITTP